nr:hypothetical protein [Rhizoctonia sp.]
MPLFSRFLHNLSLLIHPAGWVKVTIVLFYVAAFYLSVVYIQSIESDIGIFSRLFSNFLSIPECAIEGISLLFFYSSLPIKPKRLTKTEKEAFLLPEELKQILVGLLLGDLYIYKQKLGINPCLMFIQGLIHKEYLFHLYSLFETYCRMAPVISNLPPDKRTRKIL